MSVATAKAVLAEFLTSDRADVLALTGNWGVGKTYAWRQALLENKAAMKRSSHCYVSLFGVRTLSELKTEVAPVV